MKAKDYAAKFRTEASSDVLRQFVRELEGVISARGGSAAAVEGAVREFEQKFRAVLRLEPTLGLDIRDFDDALYEHLRADLMRRYVEASTARYEHQIRLSSHLDYRAAVRAAEQHPEPELRLALRLCALFERRDRLAEI
jgi:hypothetical protein